MWPYHRFLFFSCILRYLFDLVSTAKAFLTFLLEEHPDSPMVHRVQAAGSKGAQVAKLPQNVFSSPFSHYFVHLLVIIGRADLFFKWTIMFPSLPFGAAWCKSAVIAGGI